MATEILVKIYVDGTGDYTSLKSGWDASAQDLVAADSFIVFELKGDLRNTDGYVDGNGYTTDATRKIIIRPISGDETTGIAAATGTLYGTNTYLLVGRSQFIDFDGLEVDGFSSAFHSASNINVKNCLIHSGSSAIGDPTVSNTIIYDCASNTLSSTNCDRVTAVNPGSVIYRNAGGVITASVGYGRDGGGTTYYNTTNAGNNNNASNDGTAPGTTTYAISQSDFVDYVNKNYNISPSSSLYANNVGADLAPASGGGTTGLITQTTQSFSQSMAGDVNNSYTGTVTQNTQAFTQSASGSVTSQPITGAIDQSATAFTQSAIGDVVSSGINGSITQLTSAFTQSASGTNLLNVSGAITQTLGTFTQSVTGTVAEQISGVINQSISSFTMSAIGVIPVSWHDSPQVVTAYENQAPVTTTWSNK
jgi:hypothetical protein